MPGETVEVAPLDDTQEVVSYAFSIYYGSPLVPAKAAATLPGVYCGSPLVPVKAAATLPGVYYGCPLEPDKRAPTLQRGIIRCD